MDDAEGPEAGDLGGIPIDEGCCGPGAGGRRGGRQDGERISFACGPFCDDPVGDGVEYLVQVHV